MVNCDNPQGGIEAAICEVNGYPNVPDKLLQGVVVTTKASLAEENGQIEAGEKISATVRLIGPTERKFLHSYFQIPYDSVLAVKRIQEIQHNDLNLQGDQVDGIVGPQTLKLLYTQIYSRDLNSLPTFQRERWKAYQEMCQYQDWSRWVAEKNATVTLHNPYNTANKVFNRNYYLGHTGDAPRENTYINESLLSKVPNKIGESGLQGKLITIEGKQVILMYEHGNLTLASYTSIGNSLRYGSGARTTNNITRTYNFSENDNPSTLSANIDHISGARDSVENVKNSHGSYNSDPMPYAVRIIAGEYSHAGEVTGTPRSHGCSRLPLFYAKGVYEKFKQHGTIRWQINY